MGLRAAGWVCLLFWLFFSTLPSYGAQPDPERGKKKYRLLCAGCHGVAGKGNGPAAASLNPKPRDYTDKEFIARMTDASMFEIIKRGGAAVKKSPSMPAWGEALSERDIRDLIAYIRTLAGVQPK